MQTKKCRVCKKEFTPINSLNVYCSYQCSYEVQKKSIKKYQTKVKKKKPKVIKVSSLKNKADDLWRSVGKERAVCEICYHYKHLKVNYTQLQAHHIVGRRNMTLRWDLRNRAWLCPVHHTFGVKSAHQDPQWFIDYLLEYRKEDFEYLENKKNKLTKVTKDRLQQIIEDMQKI